MELIITSIIGLAGAIVPTLLNKPKKDVPATREDGLILTKEHDPVPGYVFMAMAVIVIILTGVIVIKGVKK